MHLHGHNLIGHQCSAQGSSSFHAVNPATGQKLEPAFIEATAGEVDAAAQAADQALDAYASLPASQRADFLQAIAQRLDEMGEALTQRAHAETGLPPDRLNSERNRTANQLRLFAHLVREGSWVDARIDRAQPDRQPLPKPDLRRMLVPIGPVAVFGASNFPLAFSVAGGDTASALAAGCPVVVKAHPGHPGTCELAAHAILQAARDTGMPDGVFSMVHGTSHDVGLALVRHPLIQAVGFTGSQQGGRALCDAAAARPQPIPVHAEMGSINPVFILPGAITQRGDDLARGLSQSVTLGVGQFCTNPGLVLGMDGPAMEQFTSHLAQCIGQAPLGVMLHAGIRASYQRGTEALRQARGVRLAGQAEAPPSSQATLASAALFVTDEQTWLANPLLAEEVFGPSTLLVKCADSSGLYRIARALQGQLTATIHGTEEDLREHAELLAILRRKAGRLLFNGMPTGVEVCPAMHHGGPYPACSDPRFTSVGTAAILRFARPVCYQNFPQHALPVELRDDNERGIWRLVDGQWSRDAITH